MAGGIAIAVIPLLVVGLFAVDRASDGLTEMAEGRAVQMADDIAESVEVFLVGETKLVKQLASGGTLVEAALMVRDYGLENSRTYVDKLQRDLKLAMKNVGQDYELILVTDDKGTVFADSMGGAQQGVSISDRSYFHQAKAGETVVAQPVKSKSSGKPVVPVCSPVKNEKGDILGTIAIVLKIDSLVERISSVEVGRTGYPFMLGEDGVTIAHPREELILELNAKSLEGMEGLVKGMLAGEKGVLPYEFEGVDKVAGFAPVGIAGWSVGVTQNKQEFLAQAADIRNGTMVFGGIFLGVTVFCVFFFARSITRPINRIIDGLNDGAEQVASASSEVSTASQSLAEGASEQASSIEETSSSLEEMASMTRQNADHANEADNLMKEAKKSVENADSSMSELTASMVEKTNYEFSEVAENASKVAELLGEIAAASNEQAQGIEQVNKAVAEMDKVVQQNAATAEESASASEEMNAQAEQMKGMVAELVSLVGRVRREAGASESRAREENRPNHAQTRPPARAEAGTGERRPAPQAKSKEVNPEQLIPMDEKDFKDF